MGVQTRVDGCCKMCHKHWVISRYDAYFLEKNGFVCPNCIDLYDNIPAYPAEMKKNHKAKEEVSRFELLDLD